MRPIAIAATAGFTALFAASTANADLAISSKATQNVSCSNGVCTATAQNAVLNAGDLATMLAGGDVTVKTGGGATNIVVKAGVSWTSASRLTFDANRSVEISKPVSVTSSGAVTITTNDGGSGGDLMFDGKGNVKFWDMGSSLVINGNSYTLVKDIATLASDIAAKPSGFFALASDYDASVDGTYNATPISTELAGTFEGLNHKIDQLSISTTDSLVGLFASASGTLRDLQVTRAFIHADGGNGGVLLAGTSSAGAKILGCSATGSIVFTGGPIAGGPAGSGKGTIARSHADVAISAPGASVAGGLVGASQFAISLSYATGSVRAGDGAFVGGLVGSEAADGNVSQSFSSGNVSAGANSSIGGLAGVGSGIENSYAMGTTTGAKTAIVGGLVGQDGFAIISSYSTGRVKGGVANSTAGGLLGLFNNGQPPHLSSDYWNTETTGRGRRAGCGGDGNCGRGAKGLTTGEFQSGLPAGFDPAIWGENASINNGYPYLIANPPQ